VDLGGAFAALVFAIHPLRVESVAWITERRDLTSGAFFFLTLLAWLKGLTDRKWYWISVLGFAAMILCKAMGMTLPLLLLLLDVYPLFVRKVAPFFVGKDARELEPLLHLDRSDGHRRRSLLRKARSHGLKPDGPGLYESKLRLLACR
jgi:hypothetical protein